MNKDFAQILNFFFKTMLNVSVTSWKLSRRTTLSPEASLIMDKFIETTQGLNQDYYQPTNQTEDACFYIPEVNKNEAPRFRGQCETQNIVGVQGFDVERVNTLKHFFSLHKRTPLSLLVTILLVGHSAGVLMDWLPYEWVETPASLILKCATASLFKQQVSECYSYCMRDPYNLPSLHPIV